MKKFMMTLAAVLCCAMTTAVFTSCGDDDNGGGGGSDKPKIVGYEVTYSLDFPQEKEMSDGLNGNFYRLCSKIEVGYPDENGKEQKETVNNWSWTKTVSYKSVHGSFNFYVTFPEDIDESSLTYDHYSRLVTVSPTQKDMFQKIKAVYSDGTKMDLNTATTLNIAFYSVSITQYTKEKTLELIKKYPTIEEPLASFEISF